MLTDEQRQIIAEIKDLMHKSDIISDDDTKTIRQLIERLPDEIQADYGEIFSLIGQGVDL